MMNYEHLIKNLDAHTTLLTPNQRLSATLHKYYQKEQRTKHSAWLTPDILPLSTWTKRLFNEAINHTFASSPFLLNTMQEQFLWEQIIATATENKPLLQISETADMAKSAWGLLKQWQIDIHHSLFHSTPDYAALQQWAIQFTTTCREQQWLDQASLPPFLIEKIIAKQIRLPNHIVLVGFTEIAPQLNALLLSCQQVGSKVTILTVDESIHHSPPYRLCLKDIETEIAIMARWTKAISTRYPNATIGCVIPSLDNIRARVMQIFSEVYAADNTYTIPSNTLPFNISAGKSLLHYPIIHTAILLLSLHQEMIKAETLNYLLASPFIGGAETERIARCLFDSLLRQNNVNHVSLSALIKKTPDEKALSLTHTCPQFAANIQQFLLLIQENNQKKSYFQWVQFFAQLLTVLGWPGERSLNSEEYQVVESWLKLLTDYQSLSYVAEPVYFHQALAMLEKMASKAIFQPQTPETSIQILGLLEAAALPFDYLWVTGMDDLSWPPQPKPNPFIPKMLQNKLNMPHATAERELMFCQRLMQQFQACSKHLIFSYPERNDELELQASPLIREFSEIHLNDLHLPDYQSPSQRIYQKKQIETLIDAQAIPISNEEKIRGGVSIIQQQALCPFKAFAKWRLHAYELENPSPGLRARDRGTLLHKALELIWNELKDHAALVAIKKEELEALIRQCIHHTFIANPHSRSEYKQYMALEKQRLEKLLWDWLQLEKERAPFKVLTHEKSSTITLNKLNLSIRIDRIDELADGKKLIIDYKMGKYYELHHWFSPRPEEPQLPLYTLLDPENIVGISFAQLAAGEHRFKGISQYTIDIKNIKLITEIKHTNALTWHEQLAQWRSSLTYLSDEFSQGIAKVDPKDPPQTCLWCALKPLCRVNEEMKDSS